MDWKALDALIDRFDVIRDLGQSLSNPNPDWKAVWAMATEIQEAFRHVRYPSEQERDLAWQRFVALREKASARAQRERDERWAKSEYHRDVILKQVTSARAVSLPFIGEIDVAEMKRLGGILNEARKMLSANKTEMLAEHKQECFARIKEMQESHDAWWSHLKQKVASGKRERIQANLDANYERHRKCSEALASYRTRANELRAKIASAWSPKWAAGASERLAEIEGKIKDIEESLKQIEKWIQEDEKRLRDIE